MAEDTTSGDKKGNWERDALERIALAAITEQRRARRWGIFFKLLFVLLVLLLIVQVRRGAEPAVGSRYTALVDLDGEIDAQGRASADNVIAGLRAAFADRGTVGVILRANSPGGSPVQSAYINDEIARLRREHPKVKVYAVITDMCASGCYYAVAAADKIYANKASLVGSIGVLMDGFGFVDTLKKLGIQRRLLTAGKNKGFLDPFSPLRPDQRAYAERMLAQIHRQFIDTVKKDRGKVLDVNDKNLFSGLVWTGERAKQLGLVDDFGSPGYVARNVIGAKDIVDFTVQENLFDRFAQKMGVAMARTFAAEAHVLVPQLR